MNTEIEYYPMPSFPTLSVNELIESSKWYQETLGFQLVFEMKGQNGSPFLIHLRWAKYADLLLVGDLNQSLKEKGVGVSLNFAMVNKTVDELANRITKMSYKIENQPSNKPWNAREMTVLDPTGYRLVFTQPIEREKSFDEVIENVKENRFEN